jgi:hypothetical protein
MKPRFAICVDNSEYPVSPELHKIYRGLPDVEAERDGDLRVIDESGEDYYSLPNTLRPLSCPRRQSPFL